MMMLKSVGAVLVSGALGGIGLLYSGHEGLNGPEPRLGPYRVEIGVVFPEVAVRATLPERYEPAAGFTGGIAVYSDQEGAAGSPLSTGYIWIDVVAGGTAERYTLQDFRSEIYEDTSTAVVRAAGRTEAYEAADGVLHIITRPDRVSGLELVVRRSATDCSASFAAEGALLAFAPTGSQEVIHRPMATDWCVTEADVALAKVTAPPGHRLRPFVPRQVLWAEIATPSGDRMPDSLLAE
jgi:hypothetical protein